MSKGSPKTVPWPLSKALAWCLTRNEEFAQEVASHDRSSPSEELDGELQPRYIGRAMLLDGCFGDELKQKNTDTDTAKRSKSDDELLSFPALVPDYQGPFRKLAEAYSAAAGARLSLDHYLLSKWLSAFEDVKGRIVDGALEAWADDEILPPYVASTLRITPHPLDERFPLNPDSPWLLRPNEALTESGHKKRGLQVNRDQLLRLFPKKEPSAVKNSISAERRCTEWLTRQMRPQASGPCVPTDEPKQVWLERAKQRFAGLSDRGFDRCWTKARSETGSDWGQPGRKRKSSHR